MAFSTLIILVLSQFFIVVAIKGRCSKNSWRLSRAIARWCQPYGVVICGALRRLNIVAKNDQVSSINVSWINTQRWYCVSPRLDRTSDASLEHQSSHNAAHMQSWGFFFLQFSRPKIDVVCSQAANFFLARAQAVLMHNHKRPLWWGDQFFSSLLRIEPVSGQARRRSIFFVFWKKLDKKLCGLLCPTFD
jgi:hypothetical protein